MMLAAGRSAGCAPVPGRASDRRFRRWRRAVCCERLEESRRVAGRGSGCGRAAERRRDAAHGHPTQRVPGHPECVLPVSKASRGGLTELALSDQLGLQLDSDEASTFAGPGRDAQTAQSSLRFSLGAFRSTRTSGSRAAVRRSDGLRAVAPEVVDP